MKNYLWKYMAFDKLQSLLDHKALYLPSFKHLQESMDPIEGRIFTYFQNKIDEEIKFYEESYINRYSIFGKPISIGEKLKNNILKRKYVYSLTYDNAENYSLWNIYTTKINKGKNKTKHNPERGIAIKINPYYFKKTFLNNNIKVFYSIKNMKNIEIKNAIFENIHYKSNEEIMNIINNKDNLNKEYFENNFEKIYHQAMFVKSNYYKFAKEKRYVISINRNFNKKNKNIWLSIDLQEFFKNCEIILSPYSDKDFANEVKEELKKYNIENIDSLVCESEILLPPQQKCKKSKDSSLKSN